MKSVLNKRKGYTLVELSIVLAIVAIISVIVVSFSLLVNNNVNVTNAKLNANSDLTLIETIAERWIIKQTENKADFYVNEFGLCATVNELTDELEEEPYLLSFQNGVLTGTLPNAEPLSCITQTVNSVSFEFYSKSFTAESETPENVNSAEYDILFFCTVNYTLSYNDEINEESYVFCVNPRVGEII